MEANIIRMITSAGVMLSCSTHSRVMPTVYAPDTRRLQLTGPDFLDRKEKIVAALQNTIDYGDLDRMAAIRRSKRTL